jgi:hypothetical protein
MSTLAPTLTTATPVEESIDLYEYLDYLGKLKAKPRSALTLDLYKRSLEACKLDKIKRSELNNVWPYLRELLANQKAGAIFVNKSKTVIKGALRLNNVPLDRTKDYQFLLSELGVDGQDVEEYTDADIQTILELTFANDMQLFNACVCMSLASLRVGALKGMLWEDWKKVESVPDVRLCRVFSKGTHYIAALPETAYQFMFNQNRHYNSKYVVWTDPNLSTDFSTLIRMKLYYLLKVSPKYKEIGRMLQLEKKSILHSMRHWGISQMASALSDQECAELAGHKISNTTTRRYYINKRSGGMPLPEYQTKLALLYKKTPLFNYDLTKIAKNAKWMGGKLHA